MVDADEVGRSESLRSAGSKIWNKIQNFISDTRKVSHRLASTQDLNASIPSVRWFLGDTLSAGMWLAPSFMPHRIRKLANLKSTQNQAVLAKRAAGMCVSEASTAASNALNGTNWPRGVWLKA